MSGLILIVPLVLWSRTYFAAQAIAGLFWWVAVFVSPAVREATLGSLNPAVVALFDIPLFVIASALAAVGVRAAAVVSTGWTGVVAVALAVYATITREAGWGVLSMGIASAGSLIALCLIFLGRVPTSWILRGPFAFRQADIRPIRANVAHTLGQIVFFWGFFLAAIPVAIAALERRWEVALPFPSMAGPVGVGVLLLASSLGVWSAAVMSRLGAGTPLPSAMPNRLVIAGPYRWIRNPMAAAGTVQAATVGLILQSWLVIVYAVAGSLVWNYAIRPLEESDLHERFGQVFEQYRDDVRCWIPRVPNSKRGRQDPRFAVRRWLDSWGQDGLGIQGDTVAVPLVGRSQRTKDERELLSGLPLAGESSPWPDGQIRSPAVGRPTPLRASCPRPHRAVSPPRPAPGPGSQKLASLLHRMHLRRLVDHSTG